MEKTLDRELKKGSAELLILALLEEKARHGYEIGKLIDERSEGVVRFHVASLYPLLYRLERRGWVKGEWEPAGGRRRRFYRLTASGRKTLASLRTRWREFSGAMNRIVEVRCARLGKNRPRQARQPSLERRPARRRDRRTGPAAGICLRSSNRKRRERIRGHAPESCSIYRLGKTSRL